MPATSAGMTLEVNFSPPALQAQSFGKVAAEQVLAEVHELTLQVDVNLAADVAPAAAKRVILGEIASRIGIDHAVEETPVEVALRIVGRTVGHVVELGIFLHHMRQYVPLDHHEPGWRLRHFDEAVGVRMGA